MILLSKDQSEAFEILKSLRKMCSEIPDAVFSQLFAPAEIKRKFFDVVALSFKSSQKAFQTLLSNFCTKKMDKEQSVNNI